MEPYLPEPLPLTSLRLEPLIPLLGRANRELARYDGLLHGVQNPALMLSPMTTQEAVLSSKIEGTQATLSEVLQFEADELFPMDEDKRNDIVEVRNYRRALQQAQALLGERPMNLNLLLELHRTLLDSVRGKNKAPGKIRTTQNWIGPENAPIEQATFVPPNPLDLPRLLSEWENYYHQEDRDPLIHLAVVHAQFEILHPFNDGNGRIGRILIPLFLFEKKLLSHPMFYLSAYFEAHHERYIARLRGIGHEADGWDRWLEFFLSAVAEQSAANSRTARSVISLYEELKARVLGVTHSAFAVKLLDNLFDRPVISPSDLARKIDMPTLAAVSQMLKRFQEAGVVRLIREGHGRRPAIYALHELINTCEGRKVF